MVGDPSKGYEIARYSDEWAEDKGKRLMVTIYPYLGFTVVPLVAITLFTLSNIDAETRNIVLLTTMPFAIGMALVCYFLFDNILSGKRNPIIVYSNGIEHANGRMDRLRKISDFVPKGSISQVEVYEFTHEEMKGRPRFMSVKIKIREGKEKFIAARRIERMKGFREAVARLGVPIVERDGTAATGPAPVASYSAAPSNANDGVMFCDVCGTRVEHGASFCGRCGKRLR
jgi:hypothetical protein